MEKEIRARVFISCGQSKDTDEVDIAHKIAEKLKEFEPYIAGEEQSLEGVKENIFRRLSESEYLIFVDFKRERLDMPGDESVHRGSLFSHQELAIAALLDIEILAFQEEGVKKEDGILKFIQANCIPFKDRHLVPDVVAERVRERGWDPNWRNELSIERDDKDFDDIRYVGGKDRPARFYHIRVKNLHEKKIARDCIVYLERWKNLSTCETTSPELVEFKWKGITTSRVAIPPNQFRYLDAFFVYHDSPNIVKLGINHTIVDFSGYHLLYTITVEKPVTFELDYIVFSENFSPTKATFTLRIGNQLDDIAFYIGDRHRDMA